MPKYIIYVRVGSCRVMDRISCTVPEMHLKELEKMGNPVLWMRSNNLRALGRAEDYAAHSYQSSSKNQM